MRLISGIITATVLTTACAYSRPAKLHKNKATEKLVSITAPKQRGTDFIGHQSSKVLDLGVTGSGDFVFQLSDTTNTCHRIRSTPRTQVQWDWSPTIADLVNERSGTYGEDEAEIKWAMATLIPVGLGLMALPALNPQTDSNMVYAGAAVAGWGVLFLTPIPLRSKVGLRPKVESLGTESCKAAFESFQLKMALQVDPPEGSRGNDWKKANLDGIGGMRGNGQIGKKMGASGLAKYASKNSSDLTIAVNETIPLSTDWVRGSLESLKLRILYNPVNVCLTPNDTPFPQTLTLNDDAKNKDGLYECNQDVCVNLDQNPHLSQLLFKRRVEEMKKLLSHSPWGAIGALPNLLSKYDGQRKSSAQCSDAPVVAFEDEIQRVIKTAATSVLGHTVDLNQFKTTEALTWELSWLLLEKTDDIKLHRLLISNAKTNGVETKRARKAQRRLIALTEKEANKSLKNEHFDYARAIVDETIAVLPASMTGPLKHLIKRIDRVEAKMQAEEKRREAEERRKEARARAKWKAQVKTAKRILAKHPYREDLFHKAFSNMTRDRAYRFCQKLPRCGGLIQSVCGMRFPIADLVQEDERVAFVCSIFACAADNRLTYDITDDVFHIPKEFWKSCARVDYDTIPDLED